MPDMQTTIKGNKIGLGVDNELLVRDPATGINNYVPRGTSIKNIVKLSQSEFDGITPDSSTLYVVDEVQASGGDWILVQGADTSDATTAVSDAIDQAQSTGKPVYFGPGVYNISEISKTLTANLQVELAADATIMGKSGYSTPVIILDGSVTRPVLRWRGGTIDNSLRTFVAAEQSGTGLSLKRLDNFSVEDVKFQGGASWSDNVGDSGITTVECNRGTIARCMFIGQPDCGIYLSGGATNLDTDDYGDVTIQGCHFYKNQLAIGIKRQTARTVVVGNTFLENYAGVAFLEASTTILPGRQGVVSGNTFKYTQTRAVEIRVYGGVVVSGNLIEDFGRDVSLAAVNGYGVRILGGTKNLVTGNVIRFADWTTHSTCVAFDTLNIIIDGVTYTAGDNSFLNNAVHDVYKVINETSTNPNVYDVRCTGYTTANAGLNAASIFTLVDDTEQHRVIIGSTEMFRINSTNVFTRGLRFFETLSSAGTPANFSAAKYLAVKDSSSTTYYIPLATATW
jgi:hypothetical protein